MNNRILVLGKGPVAYQLAEAYRQLGFLPTMDTPQALTEVLNTRPDNRPALIAVAEEQVLDTEALETLEQLEQQETRVVPSSHACELATNREALRTKASEELGLPTLAYKLATNAEELNHPFGNRELMVERYIEFDYEVTILTVRSIDPKTGQLATPLPGMDGMLTCATQRFDQCELFARASLLLPIDVTLTSPGASHLKYRLGGIRCCWRRRCRWMKPASRCSTAPWPLMRPRTLSRKPETAHRKLQANSIRVLRTPRKAVIVTPGMG